MYEDELGNLSPPVDYDFRPETRKTFAIVRCRDCGLVFTNPMPDMSAAYVDGEDPIYLASTAQRRKTARRVLADISQLTDGRGKLLDIGCNIGVFLDEAVAAGFQVEGIERSEWARAEASKNHVVHGVPLSQLSLERRYDVVTLFGVIEHLEDPGREIATIAQALKPGGLLVVYTGDRDAWLPRLLGKRWWWYQGMHLHYFSRHTLERLLCESGFAVVRQGTYVVYFQLFSLAKSISRYKTGRLVVPLFRLPGLRNRMVGLKLPGEMILFARRSSLDSNCSPP